MLNGGRYAAVDSDGSFSIRYVARSRTSDDMPNANFIADHSVARFR
jgi:hypothetical protein